MHNNIIKRKQITQQEGTFNRNPEKGGLLDIQAQSHPRLYRLHQHLESALYSTTRSEHAAFVTVWLYDLTKPAK